MLYLKALNLEDSKKEYDFFQIMPSPDENGFMNDYAGICYQDFVEKVIPERMQISQGIGLKKGYVPDTYFFLWLDSKIIGLFKVRHYLNDLLKNGGGHIGYGILPAYRGKGYGSQGLALAIEQCISLMPEYENEIYLSCFKKNLPSLKIMLKNGAYIHHQDNDHYYTRIKINK